MFTISLDVIDREADTLQYQNGDDIYFISTKTSKTTSIVKTIPRTRNISKNYFAHKATYSRFVDFRNRGGLISGSGSAFKIIIEAEKMFIILTDNLKKLNVQNLDTLIIHHCIKKFSLDEAIFSYLNCENITLTDKPHKIVLITVLTKQFLRLRLKSYGKMFSVNTLNPKSQRHKLNKLVLFTNQ